MGTRSGRRESWSKQGIGLVTCVFISFFLFLSWWEVSYRDTVSRGYRWRPSLEINIVETKGNVVLHGTESQQSHPKSDFNTSVQNVDAAEENEVPVMESLRQQLPAVPYRLIQLPEAVNAAAVACEERPVDCHRFNDLVQMMIEGAAASEEDVRLYVIPVDPLAMIREVHPDLYAKFLQSLIDELNASRPYIRFKGSDYLFVCLASACQAFGEELAVKLADNRGTRAIFAGVELDVNQLKWPCPLRTLNIDRDALLDLNTLPEKLMKEATFMVKSHNRWVCADKYHSANYFGNYEMTMPTVGIYMEEYDFTMCTNPKSGCTMMMFLLRRMMHKEDWNSRDNGLPHNPDLSGVNYLSRLKKEKPNVVKEVHDSPFILKAIVVRHPIPRLLSGYLDKIAILKEYHRVNGLQQYVDKHGVPSFPEFADFLIKSSPDPDHLDEHFRIQSAMCGARYHRFDFVAHLSDIGPEFKEFSESLGFYDAYVASGWGGDGKGQFGVRSYQVDQRYAGMNIWKYYTEDLMVKVHNYYKEDFDRFGFDMDEILATKKTP